MGQSESTSPRLSLLSSGFQLWTIGKKMMSRLPTQIAAHLKRPNGRCSLSPSNVINSTPSTTWGNVSIRRSSAARRCSTWRSGDVVGLLEEPCGEVKARAKAKAKAKEKVKERASIKEHLAAKAEATAGACPAPQR